MLRGSEPILHKGRVIGVTTSGGYGYSIEQTIAYGYVPIAEGEHSKDYEIEVYTEIYPARREPKRALYDPERKKILC
jgi:4-methylaminobutanoate oxidase (formaldehyde-forming)